MNSSRFSDFGTSVIVAVDHQCGLVNILLERANDLPVATKVTVPIDAASKA